MYGLNNDIQELRDRAERAEKERDQWKDAANSTFALIDVRIAKLGNRADRVEAHLGQLIDSLRAYVEAHRSEARDSSAGAVDLCGCGLCQKAEALLTKVTTE